MATERRRYIRFLPQKYTFAALGAGFSRVGKIIDISVAGLAFSYLSQFEDVINDYTKITIFNYKNDFFLPSLPCMVVFDILSSYAAEYSISSNAAISQRCGVQFTDCTKAQLDKLEFFIKKYTQ